MYASGPFGGGWSTDSTDPGERAAAEIGATAEARAYVRDHYTALYPTADDGTGHFDFARLHSPWTPADPFADQYVRGNIEASSRYVLCEPGTLKYRPLPVWQQASNLRLAGDWTKNGIDIPCMEGACVSGIKAAASIMGVAADLLI